MAGGRQRIRAGTGRQAAQQPGRGGGGPEVALYRLQDRHRGAPIISYEGRKFHFRGGSFGYKLLDSDSTEVSLMASPYMMRFKRKDSHDPQLRQLSNRGFSAMAGVAVRHTAPWGLLQGNVQAEVSGHGGGVAADAKYAYPLPMGRVTLVPGVGLNYAGKGLNDYYFGVSEDEARRSGLARYRAAAGCRPTPT